MDIRIALDRLKIKSSTECTFKKFPYHLDVSTVRVIEVWNLFFERVDVNEDVDAVTALLYFYKKSFVQIVII